MTLGNLIRIKNSKEGAMNMEQPNSDLGKPSYWQLVFLQSKVNGARYNGEELPGRTWDWPKDTYLQRRLQRSKWYLNTANMKMN